MGDYIQDELSNLTGSIPDIVSAIAKYGDYIILLGGWIDWHGSVIDVSDPSNPSVSDEHEEAPSGQIAGVIVTENFFYTTGNEDDDLVVWDWSDRENITKRGQCAIGTGSAYVYQPGYSSSHPNYIFACEYYDADLESFDISDPDNPFKADTVTHADMSGARFVVCYGNYAFVWAASKFCVIDITDPTNMSFVTSIDLSLGSHLTINDDGTMVIGLDSVNHKFYIIDVSTPTSPSVLSTTDDATYLNSSRGAFFTSGDKIVITSTYDGPNPGSTWFSAWDASDVSNPLPRLESVQPEKRAGAFCVDEGYVYYGWDSGGYTDYYFGIHGHALPSAGGKGALKQQFMNKGLLG